MRDIAELFIECCDRISNPEFNDPKLEEYYTASPDLLLTKNSEWLDNMIKFFDKMQLSEGLRHQGDPNMDLKAKIAAALGKPIPVDVSKASAGYIYFGLNGSDVIIQRKELVPQTFNAKNSVIVKLIPKILKPSQKFNNDQMSGDFI